MGLAKGQVMDPERAKELYRNAKWGGVRYYQDIPELSLTESYRKNGPRLKDLHLGRIVFRGKVVWDIGCAGGFFLRYAMGHGAHEAVGFDTPEVVRAARAINGCLGYGAIEFRAVDLGKECKFGGAPDIVFYLAVNNHVPTQRDALNKARLVVLEDVSRATKNRPEHLIGFWDQFKSREYIGRGTDIIHDWRVRGGVSNSTIYHLRRAEVECDG